MASQSLQYFSLACKTAVCILCIVSGIILIFFGSIFVAFSKSPGGGAAAIVVGFLAIGGSTFWCVWHQKKQRDERLQEQQRLRARNRRDEEELVRLRHQVAQAHRAQPPAIPVMAVVVETPYAAPPPPVCFRPAAETTASSDTAPLLGNAVPASYSECPTAVVDVRDP